MTLIGSFSIAALSSFWLGALAGCLALTGEAIKCPALFYISRRYDDTPVPKPARIWAAVSGTVQALNEPLPSAMSLPALLVCFGVMWCEYQ
jgi:hypothetical protein